MFGNVTTLDELHVTGKYRDRRPGILTNLGEQALLQGAQLRNAEWAV